MLLDTYALPVHPKECVQGHVPHRPDARLIVLAQAQPVLLLVDPTECHERL